MERGYYDAALAKREKTTEGDAGAQAVGAGGAGHATASGLRYSSMGGWKSLELATQEARPADQLVQGVGWILGRANGAGYALVQ